MTRRDLETTKQESKESFSTFIAKWRSKATQMMNGPNEEEQLTMVVKNFLPIYHKYLFAQYFLNFKALIATGTQIEDAINNGTIKNEDAPKFKMNFRSSPIRLNLINHYVGFIPCQFACNSALRNPVFRWESCKGSV